MGVILKWDKNKYDVGVKLFNLHHKRLVDLLNLLHSVVDGSNNKKQIKKIFNELANYTVYHFNAEEEVMRKYDYGSFNLHQHQHQTFLKTVKDSIDSYEKGVTMVEVIKLLDFLRDWILNHILISDMKYKEFFKDKEVKYEG